MSTIISKVDDALYENRFARMEDDLGVMKWMIGFNLAMTVAILWKIFSA